MRRIKRGKMHNALNNSRGMTLVEMIVCFALLGIFLIAACAFISTITNIFYQVKGETYSRQVSDIILGKIESELDGAEYDAGVANPKFGTEEVTVGAGTVNVDYIELFDKTDTHVAISHDPKKKALKIHYYPIEYVDPAKASLNRVETDWYFDESVYNGFKIEDMKMIRGDQLYTLLAEGDSSPYQLSKYGIDNVSAGEYPENVVVVLLHLNHYTYGDYYTYRFVRMHNLPETGAWGSTPSGP